MPRQPRIDIAGVLQHVMVRGIERKDIFLDDRDRSEFVARLSPLLVKTGTDCLAWCLLSNHAHLLLRPNKAKMSEVMRRLLTGYAVVFNLRHHRCGHLFQNRYKSIVCEEDSYFLELVRYIHLNPIRAGLVSTMRQLDDYRWSGHAVLMGHGQLQGQNTDEVLLLFDEHRKRARERYRDFVADGIALGRRDELVGGGLKRQLKLSGDGDFQAYDERILGSGYFVEHLWHEEEASSPTIAPIPTINDILVRVAATIDVDVDALCQRCKVRNLAHARSVVCFIAIRRFGYTAVQVSKSLALSPSGVLLAAKRGEALYENFEPLRDLFPHPDDNQEDSSTSQKRE